MEAQITRAMEPEMAPTSEFAIEVPVETPATVYDMDPATSLPAESTPAHYTHWDAAEHSPATFERAAEPPAGVTSDAVPVQRSAAHVGSEDEAPVSMTSEDLPARLTHAASAGETSAPSATTAEPAAFEPLTAEPVRHERAPAPRVRRGRGRPPAPTYVTHEMGEPALDAQPLEQDDEITRPPAEAHSEE